jgi:hypothetical protein
MSTSRPVGHIRKGRQHLTHVQRSKLTVQLAFFGPATPNAQKRDNNEAIMPDPFNVCTALE